MLPLSHRSIAVVIALITLLFAWSTAGLIALVVMVDGVGLLLISFPDTVDDLTFGTYTRGAQIDSHTPPWIISGIGWILVLFMAGFLFWVRHTSR